jgi:protein TonB
MNKLIFILLLCLVTQHGRAQAVWSSRSIAAQYGTADFKLASTIDSAGFCVETVFSDSIHGVTRVYHPSGRLQAYEPLLSVLQPNVFVDEYRRIRHGRLTTWYDNGQMKTKEDYLNGIRIGELLAYYPDGALKRRDYYEDGRSGIGKCYDPAGQPIAYFHFEQGPLYPGGDAMLASELTRALRFNKVESALMQDEALYAEMQKRYDLQRKVELELAIAPDGRVIGAQVSNSTATFLNNAALRAVSKLKSRFVPARRDGEPIASYVAVTIKYKLETMYRYTPRSSDNSHF